MSEEILSQSEDQVTAETPATETPVETTPASFLDSLPEDLRSEGNLADFKDAAGLAKSYLSAQKMLGNSIRVPTAEASDQDKADFLAKIRDVEGVIVKPSEGATEEERTRYMRMMGVPDKPEGYDFSEVINPEIASVAPELTSAVEDFREKALEFGLSTEQAKKLVAMQSSAYEEVFEKQQASKEASLTELKKSWGQDFDNRLNAAKSVVDTFRGQHPDAAEQLIKGAAGSNPIILKALAELGEIYKERGHKGLNKVQFGMTPEKAMDVISDIKNNPSHPYNLQSHPERTAALAKMDELYRIAHGE